MSMPRPFSGSKSHSNTMSEIVRVVEESIAKLMLIKKES